MSRSHIITIGRRKWALGLTWRSFEKKPTHAELTKDAEQLDADWTAVRVSPVARQAGFMQARSELPARPRGLYSLAAAIADSSPQPWLGIYRIADDLWWYIAVREGQAILPDGDIVGGEADMHAARALHQGYDDWTFIQGTLDDLKDLIAEQGTRLRLVPVKSLQPVSVLMPLMAAATVTACAAAALIWWHNYQTTLAERHLAQLAAQRAKLEAEQRQISPLKKTPAPDAWLRACFETIGDQPLTFEAWALDDYSCGAESATLLWRRLPGGNVVDTPPGQLDATGNLIKATIPYRPLANGPDNAPGLAASERLLFKLLQPLGITAKLGGASLPTDLKPLPGAPPTSDSRGNIPSFPIASFTAQMATNPASINFDAVPGLRLHSLSIDSNHIWTVGGTLYGR